MAIDILSWLADPAAERGLELQPAACLNARFRAAGCTRCADICPTETAITVTNGRPALDNTACLQCGLCLHRCPTGAFTRPDGFSRKLARTAAAAPNGPVELVCPQHPDPAVGATRSAIQTRRCLAGLSAATLLEMTATGADIWLDDGYCAACPLGTIRPVLAQTVAEANSWAALLAEAGHIRLRSEEPDETVIERQVLDAAQPSISRRGLFGAFKLPATPAADTQTEATELIKTGRHISPSARLPHFLPPERAVILNILNTRRQVTATSPSPAETALPIAQIQIDPQRCTACGLCAKFCPTAALRFLSDDQAFVLTFQPDLCLGVACNICQSACPEYALTTTPASVSPGVLTKRPLITGNLTRCPICQSPLAQGPALPTTCFACRPRINAADLFASFS